MEGSLILSKLWRMTPVSTSNRHIRSLFQGDQEASPSVGQYSETILHHTSAPGNSVVGHHHVIVQTPPALEKSPQGKGIIPQDVVGCVSVIIGQGIAVKEVYGVVINALRRIDDLLHLCLSR